MQEKRLLTFKPYSALPVKLYCTLQNLSALVLRFCVSKKGGTGGGWCHLQSEGSFLAGKDAWVLSGCLTAKSAEHCMLVNEWAWLRSQVY